MASKLDQLRAITTVVADTGDLDAVARLKPVDCTANPTIVLKAVDTPEYRDVVDEALPLGRRQSSDAARVAAATADRLAVSVGVELLRLVPGYVSTEVDAKVEDGRVVLLHTEVPQEPPGLGYGSRLAHGVFEALRRDGKRVIAKCPFMSSYTARHPEYDAPLDG